MRVKRRLYCWLLAGAVVAGCGDNTPAGDGGAPDMSVVQEDQGPGPSSDMAMTQDGPSPDLVTMVDEAMGPDIATVMDMTMVDTATPPCGNTGQSCGMPGACVDCTNSIMGHACVNMACGCNAASDCPIGNACDPNTHQCTTKCGTNMTTDAGPVLLACNQGCCDGNQCVAGNANSACGNNGGACAACGGGTPTCAAGACTPTCAVGMGGATCGQGFCCNAMNTCSAIGQTACGVAGGACADCTKSPAGSFCNKMNGMCGCQSQMDCPMGQACTNGACGTACSANSPCNGGCCDSVKMTCTAGNVFDECALGMAVCGTCVGNPKGGACLAGAMGMPSTCGCNTNNDCPNNQACNTMTHTCGSSCDANTPCNGGCCSIPMGQMTGTCVAGTLQAACGNNGGVCSNCATQFQGMKSGQVCEPTAKGGFCGCGANADCPANSTGCNAMTNLCNFSCSMQTPCLSGCCSIPMGQTTGSCSTGTANNACGATGVCTDCSMNAKGHLCTAQGGCGCNTAADCPVGNACINGTCGTACTNNNPCNGGCCSNGTCAAGTMAAACGATGNACVDCSMNNSGHLCLSGNCGCNAAADCPASTACNTMTHKCEATCGDANHTTCNGGCCSTPMGQMTGTCVAGTSNSACGANGGACAACASGKPTCTMGACTDACGAVGNGTCGGGFCCSNAHCVAGNAQTTCGFTGTCNDCSANTNGHKCETGNMNGPWFCGCDGATDCPAADVKAGTGGEACVTASHTCTTQCDQNLLCNGGCCSALTNGVCRSGTATATCGTNGGVCSNCTLNCNKTPTCNNGSCGCCGGTNANCAMGTDCCSGTCGGNGRCACVPLGMPCVGGTAALCCGGGFGNTQCSAMGNCCLPRFSNCAANTDCCSGTCGGGGRCQ